MAKIAQLRENAKVALRNIAIFLVGLNIAVITKKISTLSFVYSFRASLLLVVQQKSHLA